MSKKLEGTGCSLQHKEPRAMHFCTANVAIGGDLRNVMTRDYYSPLSWPEIELLNTIHGSGAIQDVVPFVAVNQQARTERARLENIYGVEAVVETWGKGTAISDLNCPEYNGDVPDTKWFNPLTFKEETTEAKKPAKKPEPEEDLIGATNRKK
jgi:hypothetical protein